MFYKMYAIEVFSPVVPVRHTLFFWICRGARKVFVKFSNLQKCTEKKIASVRLPQRKHCTWWSK
jgi:hypothetical protein